MKNYAKAVLYAYPLLETVEKDYEEHIRNKAILSYKSEAPAEAIAQYIIGEIAEKQKLVWLKSLTERVLNTLSDVERTWIAVRYFKKTKKFKNPLPPSREEANKEPISQRTYFRMQSRLGNKVGEKIAAAGLTGEVFEKEFSKMKFFEGILRFLAAKKDRGISENEKRWLRR